MKLDYTSALAQWYDRIDHWRDAVSFAARPIPEGEQAGLEAALQSALQDGELLTSLYQRAVAEVRGSDISDALLHEAHAAFHRFLTAAWELSEGDAYRVQFYQADGELIAAMAALFNRIPADNRPATLTGGSDTLPGESTKTLIALLGDEGVKAMKIIDSALTIDEKLTALARLDGRFLGYDSRQLADLLNCSSVRHTRWWKEDRPRLLGDA